MGCAKRIRTDLSGFLPGGTWKYVGYSTTKNTAFNQVPTVPLLDNLTSETDLSSLGDDFIIDSEGKSAGYYLFTYTLPSDTLEFELKIIADTTSAGSDILTDQNTAQGTVDLSQVLQNETTGGTWTAVTDVGNRLNGSVLTLTGLATGNYYFKYSLLDGYTNKGCDNCPGLESLVLVRVSNGIVGTISSVNSTVEYRVKPYSLTDVENQVTYEVNTPHTYNAVCKFKVFRDNVELTQFSRVDNIASYIAMEIGVKTNNAVFVIPSGSYIKQVVLKNSETQNNVTVLTGPTTAQLSGNFGYVSPSNLYITAASRNAFPSTIATVIKNTLNTANTKFSNKLEETTGGYVLALRTTIAATPMLHYGVVSFTVVKPDLTEVLVTTTSNGFKDTEPSLVSTAVPFFITDSLGNLTECPNVMSYMVLNTWLDVIFDKVNSVFDNLILIQQPLVSGLGDNNIVNCPTKTLTANVQFCTGTLTYSWRDSLGGIIATTQSVKVPTGDTYYVDITCSTGSSLTLTIQL